MNLYDEVVAVVTAAGFTVMDPASEVPIRGLPVVSVKYAGGEMDADSRWPRHAVEVGLYAALETEKSAHSALAGHMRTLVQYITDHLQRGNIISWSEARYGQDEGDRPTPADPVYSIIRIEE